VVADRVPGAVVAEGHHREGGRVGGESADVTPLAVADPLELRLPVDGADGEEGEVLGEGLVDPVPLAGTEPPPEVAASCA
jgi:hypothetical protein